MVLPVLLVVVAMALWVLVAVAAQLRCTGAAGVGARAAARGDAPAQVVAQVRSVAPAGAEVQVRSGPETVEVVVHARVTPWSGALRRLPAAVVTGRAVAGREDGGAGG